MDDLSVNTRKTKYLFTILIQNTSDNINKGSEKSSTNLNLTISHRIIKKCFLHEATL